MPKNYRNTPDHEFPTRTIGVVEKCTFCYERLAKGLKPACVEESNGTVVFGDIEDPTSEIKKNSRFKTYRKAQTELGTRT